MKEQIVDEVLGGTVHGGEHVGDFIGERGELLLLAALGGQGGQMALKDDAGFKHLPGLKAMQGADKTERGGSELRRTVGDEGANAVADLHDAHGCHVPDAGAEAGAADFEGTGKLAFRRNFVARLEGSALNQGADVVNHLHRTMSIRLFFLHPRHKQHNPLAILKISVTGRLPLIAGVWLEKSFRWRERIRGEAGRRHYRVYFRSDLSFRRWLSEPVRETIRMKAMLLHEDRLFPAEADARKVARSLYEHVRGLPIISPHGHTQAAWFADNVPFPDPATLFVQPDHYVFRMLYSQGISLDDLGIGQPVIEDPRKVWRIFAKNYYLFRGTPTRMWLDYAFQELFGLKERLSEKTADHSFDVIAEKLRTPEFLPRALYEKFNIEVLSTTESPLDELKAHQAIRDSGWKARIVPAFRPDPVVDPEFKGFAGLVAKLGEMHGEDSSTWNGYLKALMKARARFKALGCTSTDHGHPTAQTADLSQAEAAALFSKVVTGKADAGGAGTVPRADADGNGADERGRWPGDADSSRVGAQPQPFCL